MCANPVSTCATVSSTACMHMQPHTRFLRRHCTFSEVEPFRDRSDLIFHSVWACCCQPTPNSCASQSLCLAGRMGATGGDRRLRVPGCCARAGCLLHPVRHTRSRAHLAAQLPGHPTRPMVSCLASHVDAIGVDRRLRMPGCGSQPPRGLRADVQVALVDGRALADAQA